MGWNYKKEESGDNLRHEKHVKSAEEEWACHE